MLFNLDLIIVNNVFVINFKMEIENTRINRDTYIMYLDSLMISIYLQLSLINNPKWNIPLTKYP